MAAAGVALIPTAAFLLAVFSFSARPAPAIQILVPLAATMPLAIQPQPQLRKFENHNERRVLRIL